ncbi:MAG: SurA N-terminal domain-containing protein [Alphaproteobacteria bacterium]|nr:SurA N-terminal domain-containing protein [Alphaproteobacteria bacterium]
MLEYLRNAADKTWAKVLMFILIFSFVGWGAAEWIFSGGTRDTTILTIGGETVSVQQFNAEKSKQLSMMTKDQQRLVYTDPIKAGELSQSILQTLTMNQLALNKAKDFGFVVSDKRIANEIRTQYPEFQNQGQFSQVLFDMVLRNSGITEQEFANILRASILRQMAIGSTTVPLKIPDFAVTAAYNARYAKREIQYSVVLFKDFVGAVPTDEQLKDYYAQHPKMLPETRSVSYVFVSANMDKPDEYDAGFKKAQGLEDMIISGETMEHSANKMKAKYVKLPKIARNGNMNDKLITPEIISKIFSLDIGQESELIELKKGFIILRVDDIISEHTAEFESVKKDLIADWKKSQQRKNAYVKANETLLKLNNKEDISGLKKSIITRTEGAPLQVLSSVFAENIGNNILVETSDAFYVVRIVNETAPQMNSKMADTIRKELEKMSLRYTQDDYIQFLKRHYSVKFNEKTFNRFINR